MNAVLDTSRANGEPAREEAKSVSFFLAAPEAKSVHLMGDFNDWSPKSLPMERRKDGWWTLRTPLSRGHHQYLFVVDGNPRLDPHASGTSHHWRYERVSLIAVN